MIGFYQDAALQDPAVAATPKRFLLPLAGGVKPGTLYLGDPYTATVTASAAIGAAVVSLDQTFQFPALGSAVVYVPANGSTAASQMVISYTGTSNNSLTGVTGITQTIGDEYLIRPNIVWRSRGNVVFFGSGSDVPNNLLVAFGVPTNPSASCRSTAFGVAGGAYISAPQSIAAGAENMMRIDIGVTVPPGVQQEFTNWGVSTSSFFAYQSGNTSAIPTTALGVVPMASGYVIRRDQMLPLAARLLPSNRQVSATTPGFVIGQYRWRDEDEINAAALVPIEWDADVNAIGIDKFTCGIGDNNDLQPLEFVEGTGNDANSVFLQIQDGSYFAGPVRYFLPGTPGLEFHPGTVLTHVLANQPNPNKLIFVGTWQQDSDGFYSVATSYRYQASAYVNDGSPQFQLNQATKTITINQPLAQQTLFLGVLGGTGNDTFNLPVYPIYSIQNMYIALGGDLGTAALNSFDFDSDDGTVSVTSTPGGLYTPGQPVYAVCNPAIALQYELAPQTYATTHTYRLSTAGQGLVQALASLNPSQTYSSGIWVDGALAYNLGASYNVLVVDRATMVNESFTTFEIMGSQAAEAEVMANFLNSLDSNKIVIIVSYGDPQSNRLVPDLLAAIRNCGGGPVYASAAFCAESAYILVGIPGIGYGNGLEYYKGSGDNDPTASLCIPLTITAGNVPGINTPVIPSATNTTTNTRQLPVDLNPAFSGITSGFVYLQHRQLAPVSISLACDKPLIAIPATLESIIDLVAYGPVYFNGDYSLLSATAHGPLNGEVVPNVTMKVVVDTDTWSGLINYQDPTAEEVTVTTGADGVVNMIYTPKADWGVYVPTTAAGSGLAGIKETFQAGDTVVLPEALPISQVWDGANWLVTLYSVLDNSPIYGMIDANTIQGQIPWTTSGTPGEANYKTNGQFVAWIGPNTAQVTLAAAIGASSISLNQTGNFPASGTAVVDNMIVAYTGKTATALTGVTGITAAISVGDLIYPPRTAQGPIVPIEALDVNGNNFTSSLFTGEVVALVYAQPIPSSTTTGAYFLTFLQRVQINLQVVDSNLSSNTVLLQMADPPLIIENPWLVLSDAIQGYLAQYRLGQSNAGSSSGPTSLPPG